MTEFVPGALMRAEIAQIPEVVAAQLAAHGAEYAALGRAWREEPPAFFVTCARGTSDQAALFFKYVTEVGTGIPVASLGPSLGSLYPGPLRLSGAAALSISQSGASPDLLALMKKAAAGGAQTLALVNTPDSPLARACDRALPIAAGPERAVAATKSFVCSLVALAAIHAAQTGAAALANGLQALPAQLGQVLAGVTGRRLAPLGRAQSIFCLGRGPGLAIAGETALKLKETCTIAAEAMSAAEFRHGPIALARPGLAALVILTGDETRAGNLALVEDLRSKGADVVTVGPGDCDISTPETGHAALDAILIVTAFYAEVLALSLSRGMNPDLPPGLVKATLTL